jgi:predicted nucleic acid-binding protein
LEGRGHEAGVLVDTSVWIDFLRNETAASGALEGLIRAGRVVTAGIVIFELVQGARSDKEKAMVSDLLFGLDYVEMSHDLWGFAGTLSRSLKGRGLNLPLSDVLLAAIALKHELSLFTLDSHFDGIPGVKRHAP